MSQSGILKHDSRQRLAYVTVLHSSDAYVCGAIALAQSILQTPQSILQFYDYTIDLILLADKSISLKSLQALQAAGWTIKLIQRIINPFAQKGSYNQWNYTKLQIWLLTHYHKVIFLDSDFLVLKNMDHFFFYPQLTASPNDLMFFNSGMMVIEPSKCMFEDLMNKSLEVKPQYNNNGDQGFLNEVFTWWHRLPWRVNGLKSFKEGGRNIERVEEEKLYGIHYLGVKPWMCYRDYDCNWDMKEQHVFASDYAHKKWWQVYEGMPKELQSYCGLTRRMEDKLIKWRRRAKNANFSDGHWRIEIKDPRSRLRKQKPHVAN